jgi:CheY-like chemotaxis protein
MAVHREPPRVPRVLVVDDVREVRQLLADFLSRSGMQVIQADGGRAALTAARGAPPDLVVTDLAMPEMDGLELCRRIRAEPTTSDVPIVVVSGDAVTDGAAAWEAGCNAVLAKPCSRARLVATVERLLKTRGSARGRVAGS